MATAKIRTLASLGETIWVRGGNGKFYRLTRVSVTNSRVLYRTYDHGYATTPGGTLTRSFVDISCPIIFEMRNINKSAGAKGNDRTKCSFKAYFRTAENEIGINSFDFQTSLSRLMPAADYNVDREGVLLAFPYIDYSDRDTAGSNAIAISSTAVANGLPFGRSATVADYAVT